MFNKGDIVTVICDSFLKDRQGLIIKVERFDGLPIPAKNQLALPCAKIEEDNYSNQLRILVDLGSLRNGHLKFRENPNDYDLDVYQFGYEDLKKEKDWNSKTKSRMLWGDNPHSINFLTAPFVSGESPCMVNGCKNTAASRGLINIWGSVCDVDLCGKHLPEYHGHCMDYFPWKHKA